MTGESVFGAVAAQGQQAEARADCQAGREPYPGGISGKKARKSAD